jgi:hypothetical protein
MSSAAVRTAIYQALVAGFPSTPVHDIQNLQVPAVTDAQGRLAAFMGLLYFATESVNSVGAPDARCWRELGTADVIIFWPAGRGTSGALALADSVRAAFGGRELRGLAAGQRLVVLSADPLTEYLSRQGAPTGNYFTAMVGLSYQFDFLR